MGHYDFDRMGWQQFEHLTQALAQAELGNGLTIFGSGSDGQREATWTGKVDFPIGRTAWDGYGVLQAKHRERPGAQPDSAWFLNEIRSELNRWVAKARRARKIPRYFLFASNASLSGASDTGGKDSFEQLIDEYRPKLGIRDAVAWDYSQLRTLVDNHPDIRQTYLEQITVGDFLVELQDRLPVKVSMTAEHLAENAALELTRKRFARIGDAGFSGNARLKLAEIGIDLPGQVENYDDSHSLVMLEVAVADYVIRRADAVFRPDPSGQDAGGVLLIGGPGQGKSTIAQLIANVYRTAFLGDAGGPSFDSITDTAVAEMRDRLDQADFPRPARRRWPFVVDLAAFSQQTSQQERPSILNYLSENIVVDGQPLMPSALLDWLATWPCTIIFDGLDEVPSLSERVRLVDAMHGFVVQSRRRNVDLFIVVTTRPQGYNDEMSDVLDLEEVVMRELNDDEALRYSEALMQAHAPGDEDEQERVAGRLLEAVADKVAGNLLTSPLQVTIMTALAQRAVALPHTRHELFDAYYDVIYEREQSKRGEATLLSQHRPHVDYLHEQAGLALERESELWMGADATIGRADMESLLRNRLRNIGFEAAEAKSITSAITRATTDRLVLLVAKRANDQFGFEVRSLQEYMAARALTSGTDAQIRAALTTTFPSAHWRNTVLLAVGRLMSERASLGMDIVETFLAEDDATPESRILLTGAQLAADLYLDGVGASYPAFRRQLLSSALLILGDTADEPPRTINTIVRNLTVPNAPSSDWSILEQALRAHASLNRSSLAALILSSASGVRNPLAKIARSMASLSFAYERPSVRSAEDRRFVLSVRMDANLDDDVLQHPSVEAFIETIKMTSQTPSNEEALTISDFDSPPVRAALTLIIPKISVKEPDIAHLATTILRNSAQRRTRGTELP